MKFFFMEKHSNATFFSQLGNNHYFWRLKGKGPIGKQGFHYQFLNKPKPFTDFENRRKMNKVSLEIIGLTYSESSTGAYVLILGDKNSQRKLPIVIGGAEAESIAIGIDKQRGGRPLTHDLFLRFSKEFGIEIKEVVINRFREGVYYAMLVCQQGTELIMVDARPSDAIAIAVRCGCNICAYESVMQEAGVIMEDLESEESEEDTSNETHNINKVGNENDITKLTVPELEDLLQEAIDNEDYMKAAQIRDEIKSRQS